MSVVKLSVLVALWVDLLVASPSCRWAVSVVRSQGPWDSEAQLLNITQLVDITDTVRNQTISSLEMSHNTQARNIYMMVIQVIN